MKLEIDSADLVPIVRSALAEVLAERERLGDTERLGYPEPEDAKLLLGLELLQLAKRKA